MIMKLQEYQLYIRKLHTSFIPFTCPSLSRPCVPFYTAIRPSITDTIPPRTSDVFQDIPVPLFAVDGSVAVLLVPLIAPELVFDAEPDCIALLPEPLAELDTDEAGKVTRLIHQPHRDHPTPIIHRIPIHRRIRHLLRADQHRYPPCFDPNRVVRNEALDAIVGKLVLEDDHATIFFGTLRKEEICAFTVETIGEGPVAWATDSE